MRDKRNPHLRGQISDVRMVERGTVAECASLERMAEWSLNYLRKNPDKSRGYECRFTLYPSHIPHHCPYVPSNEYAYDVISLADTDVRMQLIWQDMREMAGIAEPSEEELGVYARCESYLHEDGVMYVNPAAMTGCAVEGVWNSHWGTAHQVMFDCDQYRRTKDEQWLQKARKGMDSLDALTVKGAGMRDLPHFTGYKDGQWLTDIGWTTEHHKQYIFMLEALLRLYEESCDQEYLERAIEHGESILNNMRTDQEEVAFCPDGSFRKHTHLHTRTLWCMAHLGYVTKDSRYIRWARRVFDFVVSKGSDFGWYPERIPHEQVSETCINGDMMAAAYYLAACGELDLYEVMERNLRNYLRCTQFFVTPDFEAFFRRLHKDKTEAEITDALQKLEALEGGFIAQTYWNEPLCHKWRFQTADYDWTVHMMGCCPPSGMLALEYIRRAAVQEKPEGIFINLNLTTDAACAKLTSCYDSQEKLTVLAKEEKDYYLRVPEWTDYDAAHLCLNGTPVSPDWAGPQHRYLRVRNVKPGDIITLHHPLMEATQTVTDDGGSEPHTYTVHWLGNSVVDIEPKAEFIDLFGDQRGIPDRDPIYKD